MKLSDQYRLMLSCFAMVLVPFRSSAFQAIQPLTTPSHHITGQMLDISPTALSLPKSISGLIGVVIPRDAPTGAFVETTLRGPTFSTHHLVNCLPVDIPVLADGDDQNHQFAILILANDVVVTDALLSKRGEVSLKCLVEGAGNVRPRDALVQVGGDLSSRNRIGSGRHKYRAYVNSPSPGHSSSPMRNRCVPISEALFPRGARLPGHQDTPEWFHGHGRSWCAPCTWRGFPLGWRFPDSNELKS